VFSPTEFREIVSGRRRGGRAAALRGALRAAEVPYRLAVDWRNRRYDRGHAATYRVDVPVICVGNLTLGGTGKTPLVKWLVEWLCRRGVRPAIVSRGYGSGDQKHNDEALELAESLPGVPHVQNPDRVAAAERAIAEFGAQAIVLDDGFQHRRLDRDLDIVLLDALEPFGFDHVFPRGTLREPVAGLRRAHVVCLSRADIVTPAERRAIRLRVAELAPDAIWCECIHAASKLIDAAGRTAGLATLAGRRVLAFCGIGNPAGFRHTLCGTGCELVGWREFPDHHAFSEHDIAELHRTAVDRDAELVVSTHKDLVKLKRIELAGRPLWALRIEMQFLAGGETLEQKAAGILRMP
jgi:tetraacyldisaccharide 4'-kinase